MITYTHFNFQTYYAMRHTAAKIERLKKLLKKKTCKIRKTIKVQINKS